MTTEGKLNVKYSELVDLPQPIFDYLSNMEETSDYLRTLFDVKSKLQEDKDYRIKFSLNERLRSIEAQIVALRAIKYVEMDIQVKHYHLLPLYDTEISHFSTNRRILALVSETD